VSGVADGVNVTLQFTFDGGDGLLYQCADLTLSSTATTVLPANVTCSNVTTTASASATPSATTRSGTVPNSDAKASLVGLLTIASVALMFL